MAVLIGLLAVLAVVVTVVVVLRAQPRRQVDAPRIDPFAVGEPWRRFVQDAIQARNRFTRSLAGGRPGPLLDRLREIGERVDAGVAECWRVAQRGDELDDAYRQIDRGSAERRLGEFAGANDDDPVVSSLRARIESADRVRAVIDDAHTRLRVLTARLDEAVARAVELAVRAGDEGEVRGLGDEVDHLVDDMEALRQALDTVQGGSGELPAPG